MAANFLGPSSYCPFLATGPDRRALDVWAARHTKPGALEFQRLLWGPETNPASMNLAMCSYWLCGLATSYRASGRGQHVAPPVEEGEIRTLQALSAGNPPSEEAVEAAAAAAVAAVAAELLAEEEEEEEEAAAEKE